MLIKRSRTHEIAKWTFEKPARAIVTSFLFVDIIGTLLLMLPIASQNGQSLGFVNALFTTVSCTCVTGLVVVDTATYFTAFGKLVIICLIQIGGLGLVTISTFFMSVLRRKVGLKTRVLAQESSGSFSFTELPSLLKSIIYTTFGFEFSGFILLSTQYVPQFGMKGGFSRAGFQAVSAFCNAGFDLMGDTNSGPFSSLTAYNDNPVVILTTAFLIISGGLGFVVWRDIFSYPKNRALRMYSKVVLSMTLLLLCIGTFFFLVAEWNNTGVQAMGTLPDWQKPFAAFFQSVTMRTAGFNSINMANLFDHTKLMSVLLMFIGAGSGSTGGGIKVSTFSVLMSTVLAEVTGKDELVMRKHALSSSYVRRAISIFFMGLAIVVTLSMLLCVSEASALQKKSFEYLDLLFEATSAFGTVGVSSANTPQLSTLSHIFIIPAMFLGRVGPVSFAISLALRESNHQKNVYPEGKIQIG